MKMLLVLALVLAITPTSVSQLQEDDQWSYKYEDKVFTYTVIKYAKQDDISLVITESNATFPHLPFESLSDGNNSIKFHITNFTEHYTSYGAFPFKVIGDLNVTISDGNTSDSVFYSGRLWRSATDGHVDNIKTGENQIVEKTMNIVSDNFTIVLNLDYDIRTDYTTIEWKEKSYNATKVIEEVNDVTYTALINNLSISGNIRLKVATTEYYFIDDISIPVEIKKIYHKEVSNIGLYKLYTSGWTKELVSYSFEVKDTSFTPVILIACSLMFFAIYRGRSKNV